MTLAPAKVVKFSSIFNFFATKFQCRENWEFRREVSVNIRKIRRIDEEILSFDLKNSTRKWNENKQDGRLPLAYFALLFKS